MNSVSSYVNAVNTAYNVEIKLKKVRDNKLTKISPAVKKTSTFQASKYVRKIMNAESQANVRAIILELKREARNSANCSDANIVRSRIEKTIQKANSKINKLSLESAMKRKKKELKLKKKQHESKRMNKKILIKKAGRKHAEHIDLYDAVNEDSKNNYYFSENNNYDLSAGFQGEYLDTKIDDQMLLSESAAESVDITV